MCAPGVHQGRVSWVWGFPASTQVPVPDPVRNQAVLTASRTTRSQLLWPCRGNFRNAALLLERTVIILSYLKLLFDLFCAAQAWLELVVWEDFLTCLLRNSRNTLWQVKPMFSLFTQCLFSRIIYHCLPQVLYLPVKSQDFNHQDSAAGPVGDGGIWKN